LESKHGKENVVYAGIHRDEITPHMYAYVVPIDNKGKLNCRAFLGGAQALRQMQTEFAQQVGQQHGLERGIEGSKARHTSIKHYYGRVNEATPRTPAIDLPETKLLETKDTYGRRVAQSVIEKIGPELNSLRAKAANADLARQQAEASEKARQNAELRFAQRERILQIEREKVVDKDKQLNSLKALLVNGGDKLIQFQNQLRQHYEKLREKNILGNQKER
jgi:hypothetical protein